jgi:hypothetical protein
MNRKHLILNRKNLVEGTGVEEAAIAKSATQRRLHADLAL